MVFNNSEDRFALQTWAIIYYSLIIIVGVIGNLIVIVVILNSKYVRVISSTFNTILFSLAVTDLLASISGLPFYLLLSRELKLPNSNGNVLCKMYIGFCSPFLFMNISQFLLLAITLERKNVLKLGLVALQRPRVSVTLKYIAVSILCATIIQAPSALGLTYTTNIDEATIGNYCYYSYQQKWMPYAIYTLILLVQSIIPFTIIFVSFKAMSKAIEQANKALVPFLQGYKGDIRSKIETVKRREKTLRLLKLMVLFFVLCLLPNHLLFVVTHFTSVGDSIKWNSSVYQLCILLWETNSCINPILYCFCSKDFRKSTYRLYDRLFPNNTVQNKQL